MKNLAVQGKQLKDYISPKSTLACNQSGHPTVRPEIPTVTDETLSFRRINVNAVLMEH